MASRILRRAIGAVKDHASIGLAKLGGSVAPVDLEILIIKATTHENEPVDEKYIAEILNMLSYSKEYVHGCVLAVSERLNKTRDWIVALKALMLVHRLLTDGDPVFGQEFFMASWKAKMRVLNMSDFRDEAHSKSWKHSRFIKAYRWYLDQKLDCMVYNMKLKVSDEKKANGVGHGEQRSTPCQWNGRRSWSYGVLSKSHRKKNKLTPIEELGPERDLERLNNLLLLVDRFLACRPVGEAQRTRMVLVAQCLLVKESFRLYADIFELLNNVHQHFSEMDYACGVKAVKCYFTAARIIDELASYYSWCTDIGVARANEIPAVQKISGELLEMLERQLKEKRNRTKRTMKMREGSLYEILEKERNENKITTLPPAMHTPSAIAQPRYMLENQLVTGNPVNQKDDGVLLGNELALNSFPNLDCADKCEKWVEFPKVSVPKVISECQDPAVATGKSCWEIELPGLTNQLSLQKANSQLNSGSDGSLVTPTMTKTATQVLALPATNGMVQPVRQQDPFAASLSIPPPTYVQISDMERKQKLLMYEKEFWKQYATNGMKGEMGLLSISSALTYDPAAIQFMPLH